MPQDEHPAATAAREEGARQAVALGAMLLAIPLAVWAERYLSRPDSARELRMRVARAGERAAARLAAAAWEQAEQFRLAYERERG